MENRAKMYKLDDILVPDSGSSEEGADSLDDSVDNDISARRKLYSQSIVESVSVVD